MASVTFQAIYDFKVIRVFETYSTIRIEDLPQSTEIQGDPVISTRSSPFFLLLVTCNLFVFNLDQSLSLLFSPCLVYHAMSFGLSQLHSSFKLISARAKKAYVEETGELCDRENDSHMIFHAVDQRLSEVQINRENLGKNNWHPLFYSKA